MRTWKWMITASLLIGDERDGSADGSSFIITRHITRSSGQPIFSAAAAPQGATQPSNITATPGTSAPAFPAPPPPPWTRWLTAPLSASTR